ncbi:MAG: 50S ribosomal protein L35 [bacterium]|nr:50S ribosomal protein L35 [bacterium]
MAKTKLKSNRSVLKRFRVTGKGKIVRRQVKLNHFNARADGDAKRRKRGTSGLSKPNEHSIKQMLRIV